MEVRRRRVGKDLAPFLGVRAVEPDDDRLLDLDLRERFEKTHPLEAWLARTGCEGADAEHVRELLADRMTDDGSAWTDTKIILRARKGDA